MHNGTIFDFDRIRRTLRQGLSDEAYNLIQGYTDTEHIFALFADQIQKINNPTIEDLAHSLTGAISRIETLKRQAGITTPSTMNLVLSDGNRILATRYVSEGEDSNSLYISTVGQFYCKDGLCHMDEGEKAFLVASEPLNASQQWERVENNHIVMVDRDKIVSIKPIELLHRQIF